MTRPLSFAPATAAVAEALYRRYPASSSAFRRHVEGLAGAGRGSEARALLEQRTRANPDDLVSLRRLAGLQWEGGDLARSETTLKVLAASPRPESYEFNQLAWLSLCRGDVKEGTLETARRAAQMSHRRDASELHTLATALAEGGKAEEAYETLVELIDVAFRSGPEGVDW